MDVYKEPIPSNSAASSSKKLPFTPSERELIVGLVRVRPIIEDKRTNAKNIELKREAWEDLTAAFNAQPYVMKRNSQQLKRCWENMKTLKKKELFQEASNITRAVGDSQGSSTSLDSVVDTFYPLTNLTVPGEIDSNSIENNELKQSLESEREKKRLKLTDDLHFENNFKVTIVNDTDNKSDDESISTESTRKTEILNTQTAQGNKNFLSEFDVRIKRCIMNMEQDQELHNLRVKREQILIERDKILMQKEKNQLMHEEEMQKLQLEKVRLEIEILKKNNKL